MTRSFSGAVLGTALGLALGAPPQAVAQIAVGTNVQVSKGHDGDNHFELLGAADPNDPRRLMACSILYPQYPKKGATIVYSSFDNGATWSATFDDPILESTGDPICAFGPDSAAYYVALGSPPGPKDGPRRFDMKTLVYRSKDGSRTWDKTPTVLPFIDREFAAVDNTKSKFRGSVYINGTYFHQGLRSSDGGPSSLGVMRSRDGINWHGPTSRIAGNGRFILGMGNFVVLSDGSQVFVTDVLNGMPTGDRPSGEHRSPNGSLEAVMSSDGGETLSEAVQIDALYQPQPYDGTSINPYLAVDPSEGPFKDRVYVVWPDQRSGHTDIYVASSSDKGKTWTRAIKVNDDREPLKGEEARDHLMPVIGVNSAGVVGVCWYDRRDNPDGLGWFVRFTASIDGGDTWLPSVRVSEAPAAFDTHDRLALTGSVYGGAPAKNDSGKRVGSGSPLSFSMGGNSFAFQGGHYSGLAVDPNGAFHPIWVDNRTGTFQIWTAKVTVAGQALVNGGGQLTGLEDVSGKYAFEMSSSRYDPSRQSMIIEGRFRNATSDTLRPPLKARILEISSGYGDPWLVLPNGGLGKKGDVFDLGHLLPAGGLLPDSLTPPVTFAVRIDNLRPIRDKTDPMTIASFSIKLFGTPKPEAKK